MAGMTVRRGVVVAVGVIVGWLAWAVVPATAQPAMPFDHVHLAVPDPEAAAAWYVQYFGGVSEPPRVRFGTTLFSFIKRSGSPQSAGSVIDHFGFSVPDLDAAMKRFEAAGVRVVTPTREIPGLFKLAFIEDPWGSKIEVVQDPEFPGFHHVHLMAADPAGLLSWYQATFGGARASLKGRLDGVQYGKVWVLVGASRGEPPAPSVGRSIDHIGWGTSDLDAAMAWLTGKGIAPTDGPRAVGDLRIAFIDGQAGVRIEIVQRPKPQQ